MGQNIFITACFYETLHTHVDYWKLKHSKESLLKKLDFLSMKFKM